MNKDNTSNKSTTKDDMIWHIFFVTTFRLFTADASYKFKGNSCKSDTWSGPSLLAVFKYNIIGGNFFFFLQLSCSPDGTAQALRQRKKAARQRTWGYSDTESNPIFSEVTGDESAQNLSIHL